MKTGVVKFFNATKGFGFITPDEKIQALNGKDLFVHKSGQVFDEELKEGSKVRFEVAEGRKGPEAAKVEIVE